MPDIQELKESTELRSRLQTVSEPRVGRAGRGPHSVALSQGPRGFSLLAPQISEVLSKCSHNVTETQRSLSCLGGELLKNQDQIHEDNRRSVRFCHLCDDPAGGGGWGQCTVAPEAQPLSLSQSDCSLQGPGARVWEGSPRRARPFPETSLWNEGLGSALSGSLTHRGSHSRHCSSAGKFGPSTLGVSVKRFSHLEHLAESDKHQCCRLADERESSFQEVHFL